MWTGSRQQKPLGEGLSDGKQRGLCPGGRTWTSVASGSSQRFHRAGGRTGMGEETGEAELEGEVGGTCEPRSPSLISALVIEERHFLERSLWPPGQNCRLPRRVDMQGERSGDVSCSHGSGHAVSDPSFSNNALLWGLFPAWLKSLIPHPQPRAGICFRPIPTLLSFGRGPGCSWHQRLSHRNLLPLIAARSRARRAAGRGEPTEEGLQAQAVLLPWWTAHREAARDGRGRRPWHRPDLEAGCHWASVFMPARVCTWAELGSFKQQPKSL